MLINMTQMLEVAKNNKFAVPAFNIGSEYLLKSVMEECEDTNSPVILAIHPEELDFYGNDFAKMCVNLAAKSRIPIVVHMDHGGKKDDIIRALRCGFTSVMIDASHETFEKNIKMTKEIVEICKPLNISVEAELGTIGNNDGSFEGVTKDVIYTQPSDVEKFVKLTDIDTLAIAIGTAHGLYPKDLVPELKLDILKEICEVSSIPLVLHGGSNNSDSEISKAVEIGIQKINISSDYKSAFYKKCGEILKDKPGLMEPNQIYPECILEARKVINSKLNLMNALGKANLYK